MSLHLTRTLRVAAHDLDLVRRDGVRIIEFEGDVLDNERPDLVAETVGIEVALLVKVKYGLVVAHQPDGLIFLTLKDRRAFTLSARISATAWSNLVRTFMASWGSMRRSVIKVSRVSVREVPRLSHVRTGRLAQRSKRG